MSTRRASTAFALVAVVIFMTNPAAAQKTVKVNFSSTATYKDSYGATHTAVVSGLSADARAAIIAKAQEKFDATLGANQVAISEGAGGGDINVIMSGERYGWYGNVGAAAGPAVVDTEVFRLMETSPGVSAFPPGAPFRNAVGETLAHEIAHRLAVGHNQSTNPYFLMTDGKLVPPAARTPGTRQFIPPDVTVILKNLPNVSSMPKPTDAFSQAPEAGTSASASANPQLLGDGGLCIDATLSFTGPAGAQFGFISASDEFVYQAAAGESAAAMTFQNYGPMDFAVQLSPGLIYRSTDPGFSYVLSNPNPEMIASPGFMTLMGEFQTPLGPATFRLDAISDPSMGGFVSFVPEPGVTGLVMTVVVLVARRRERKVLPV